jgi:hypothetical protein
MSKCNGGWCDVLLLLVVVCPLLVIVTSFALGANLAGVEGWSVMDGFYYVLGTMTGQPNPFVSNSPSTTFGKSIDIVYSIYAFVLSAVITGAVSMLSNVSSINDLPHLKNHCFGAVILIIIVPLITFLVCAFLGAIMALCEGWSIADGIYYSISCVCGVSLTKHAPAHWHGRLVATVLGVADEGGTGIIIGVTGAIGFLSEAVSTFEKCIHGGDGEKDLSESEVEHESSLMQDME